MDDLPDVSTLIPSLLSEQDSVRKYAVFKLQHALADPSFADSFISASGLLPLRQVILATTGNTQAYALGSLDALLELDVGWEAVDGEVIQKAVELAVGHPLVNIVRNALTLLVLVVGRPLRSRSAREEAGEDVGEEEEQTWGFRAIKPALDQYPQFLESLVQRLNASDHTLCANALQLVNALMRDAVVNGGENEWPRFIKRLQDLGVIGGVGMLMRGDSASDLHTSLAAAILEFQGLTKVLLRKWREVRVNLEFPEHKRALKTIHLLSKPEPYHEPVLPTSPSDGSEPPTLGARRHHPEKWRRLGFATESPAWEFDETGYLGIMDLVDFARRNEDTYHKTLLEQAVMSPESRCPLARASLSVTLILYEHFEIDGPATADATKAAGQRASVYERLEAHRDNSNPDKIYRPLLLQWGRLHTASLHAFLRLWKVSGAEMPDDFYKIEELVRILVERVVGAASRKTDVASVEEGLRNVGLETARQWQMEGLEEVYEDAWGPHLGAVREQLSRESALFMKEQRVRCLLQGAWFPTASAAGASAAGVGGGGWRYVRLSHNRRYLHYRNFGEKTEGSELPLDQLSEKIDLNRVTSVESNISAAEQQQQQQRQSQQTNGVLGGQANSSVDTLRTGTARDSAKQSQLQQPTTTSKITIIGTLPPPGRSGATSALSLVSPGADEEAVLLELQPQSISEASEWLDGLLMLLDQQPITASTTQLIDMMVDWGVRLRMLNLRWEDVDWEALEQRVKGLEVEEREVPSREGLAGEEYWYAQTVS
ncbi:hypothetical protein KC332_g8763 [Hortaea werneckii]|uniref:ELMO domain-containing protein n=2 Tax=Hortaea werneckii TaxID=91943 RepID=A0A3M7J5N8_HORWE|nr:hypothetical protein KC350_g13559 [Hortaea werneckii]OTA36220.1 hypothetical protein BTJ68_05467 [Hortaea werneckii EXF-2000]KAI6823180.1 hypothetical protein KC358_g8624 [Hortaea werneckii]KAI6925105.1 hypothetical protein KC348_g9045 [Hortaea werneckii]KAI6933167.1 hypothetical protein KC341_g8472 [Hortaea werneckii]